MNAEWNKWIWDTLEIAPIADARAVKRAYAGRLKITRPEDDADRFQQLRQAYDAALALVQQAMQPATDSDPFPEAAPPWQESVPATAAATSPVMASAPFAPVATFVPATSPAQCWHEFLGSYCDAHNRNQDAGATREIATFIRRDDFHNLDFANAFELEAARYCAEADADDALRRALATFYHWEEDVAHLHLGQPGVGYQVLAQLRADRMIESLRHMHTDGARALLAPNHPRFSLKLYRRPFTLELGQLIQHLRWNSPETIQQKLNPEVVEWWEHQLAKPRLQTAALALSVFVGVLLSLMLVDVANFSGIDMALVNRFGASDYRIGAALLGQFLCLAATLLLVFGKTRIGWKVFALRESRKAQLSWIIPAAVLSAIVLLQPESPLLRMLTGLALTVLALHCMNLVATAFGGASWLKVLGVLIGLRLVFPFGSPWLWPMFVLWPIMIVRGGEYYYRLLAADLGKLVKWRAAWLAVSIGALVASASFSADAPVTWTLCCWGLAVAGLLLSDSYMNAHGYPFLGVFGYFVVSKFASVFVLAICPELLIPATMLVTTMTFTIFNTISRISRSQDFA